MSENELEVELLPCPYCGSPAEHTFSVSYNGYYNERQESHSVECTGALCYIMPTAEGFDNAKDCIAAWNTRHPAAPSRDKVEGLVEELREYIQMAIGYAISGDQNIESAECRIEETLTALAALSTTKEEGRG